VKSNQVISLSEKIKMVQELLENLLCANQIPGFSLFGRLSVLRPAFHGAAKVSRLNLAAVNWKDRIFAHETGDNIGPS
jgi:hypothetical protein